MKFFIPLTVALGVASAVKLDVRQGKGNGQVSNNQQLNDLLRLLTGQIQNGRQVNYNDVLRQLQGIGGGNQNLNDLLAQLQLVGQLQGVGNQDLNEILRQLQEADRRQRGDDDRDREGKGKNQNQGKGKDNNRDQQVNDLIRQLQGLLGNQVNVADLLRGVNGNQQLNLDQEILNQFLRQQNVVIPGVDLQRLNLGDINQVVQGIQIMLAQLCLDSFFNQGILGGIAQNNAVANQVFMGLFQLIQMQQLGFLNNNDILGLLVGGNIFGAGGFNLGQFQRGVARAGKNAKRSQLRRSVGKRQQVDCAAVLAGLNLATVTAPANTATATDAAATETNTETNTETTTTAEPTATDAAAESSTSSAAAARRTVA